ncbi:MAG: hypothetical protein EA344_10635 [Alkalicoccus sp.]|nr:MAG: hypothetical protein EA344_10635 [Alkalicoccus sp.]
MKGNKTIIFLPIAVMLGLFIFGYFSLNQSSGFSNSDLQQNMDITIEENSVSWQWGSFPESGVAGEDYIEIVTDGDLEEAELRLTQADEVLYSSDEWIETSEGAAAPFPTYAEDEQIYGASGTWEIVIDGEVEAVRYYHTWSAAEIPSNGPVDLTEVLQERIPENHWVIEESW